jgi:hypothetical protein
MPYNVHLATDAMHGDWENGGSVDLLEELGIGISGEGKFGHCVCWFS